MLKGFTPWPDELAETYRKNGCWAGETFGDLLRDRAAKYGDRIAITCGNTHWSYQELDTRVDRLAAGFQKLGIQQMDRVVVQLPNIKEFLKLFSRYSVWGRFQSSHCLLIEAVKLHIFASLLKRLHISFPTLIPVLTTVRLPDKFKASCRL